MLDKVIKGLECCRIDENRHVNCADCPYYTDDDKGQMWCSNEINNDALELLKEQQPRTVKNVHYFGDVALGDCPSCGDRVVKASCPNFCGKCGDRINWTKAGEQE